MLRANPVENKNNNKNEQQQQFKFVPNQKDI
jgi:hypothetical protein